MPKKIIIILIAVLTANLLATVHIYGLWELNDGDVTINEDLYVHAGGIVQPYNASRILTVNGNIINKGTIRNHPTINYLLTVNCTGSVTNSGSLTNYTLNLNSTAAQTLITGSLTPIESSYVNKTNSSSIMAGSDLYFKTSQIDFPNGGGFDLTDGYGLNLDNAYLTNGDIFGREGETPTSYLNMINGAYINNSTGSNLSYTGTILIADNVEATGYSVNYGEIKSWSNGHRTFTTRDNFVNNGSFSNNPPYYTFVSAYGLFTNNGTVNNYLLTMFGDLVNSNAITASYLTFSGAAVQKLSCTSGFDISASNVTSTNTSGVSAQTDLYFSGSYINFSDFSLDLSLGFDIFLSGGYLYRTNIIGSTNSETPTYFSMIDNSYLQASILNDVTLTGEICIVENANIFNGNIINAGTLQNYPSYSFTLTINGDFRNDGIVQNHTSAYALYIDAKGDIINNGTWKNYLLTFAGLSAQTLTCLNGNAINTLYTSCANTNGVIAGSDLLFSGSYINFTDYTLDLTQGFDVSISGGYLNRMKVAGSTNTGTPTYFTMSGGCYMQNTILNDVTLDGEVSIVDNANIFNGKIINIGTLQNYPWYNYTLTVNGEFTNDGIVQDHTSGYSLYIDAKGDIINNGTWNNYLLTFAGTTTQNISCLNGNGFYTSYTSCSNTYGIKAASDLLFSGSLINFTDYTLDLTDGYDIAVIGGYLNRTNITGSTNTLTPSIFDMSGGCYMQNTILNDLTLAGEVNIVDNANVFNGNIINSGILQNHPSWNYTVTVNGNFRNEGFIQNHTYGYYLYVDVKGNIVNNGIWNNNTTRFNGSSDQQITLLNSNIIESANKYFVSDVAGTTFQWYYNNLEIPFANPAFDGETSNSLTWLVPVSSSYFGTFYCQTDLGPSRKIFVNDGTFAAPNITSFSNNGTIVSIVWDNIPSASSYKVFSGLDPYSETGWTLEGEPVTNSWSGTPVGNKKFYVVKAIY